MHNTQIPQTVRLWHIRKRTCVLVNKSEPLVGMSRSLAFSPRKSKGGFLAVGIGGRLANRKVGTKGQHDGKVVVVDSGNLKTLATFHVAKEEISAMCFSKDGNILAVGSKDNLIYLLNVNSPTDLQTKTTCRGHGANITAMSICDDTQWLMSNDGGGEMLFWNVNTGEQEKYLDTVQHAQFATNLCPLSWPMQGIWPPGGDLTDVNACAARAGIIVTADDFGKIKVFNAPSLQWCAPSMVHRGHSAHATNVRFNADGSRVISVGGSDRCIFVWRIVQNDVGGTELFEMPKEEFGTKKKSIKKKTSMTKREREEKIKAEAQAKMHKSRAAAVERGLKARNAEWAERRDLQRHSPSGPNRRLMGVGWSEHSTLGDVGPRHDDIEFTQFVGEGTALHKVAKQKLPSTSYFATDGTSLNHTMLHTIDQPAPPTMGSLGASPDGSPAGNVPSVDDRYIEELHNLADAVTDLATMQIDFTTPKRRRRDKATGRPVSGPSNGVFDGTGVPMPRLRMPKHLATKDMLHKWELRKQYRDRMEAIVMGDDVVSFNHSSLVAPVRPDGSPMPFHARSPRSPTYRALVSSRSPDAFFNARRFAAYGGYADANDAASHIQALHRGRQARRRAMKNQQEVKASVKIQSIHRGREARRESLKRQKARKHAQTAGGMHSLGDKHLDAESSFIQHTERQIAKIEQAALEKEELKLKLLKSSKFSMRRRRGSTGGGGGGSSFGIVTGRLDVKAFNARHEMIKAGQEPPPHSMEGLPWVDRVRQTRPRAAAMDQGPHSDKSNNPIRHFLQLNHVHGFRSQDMRNSVLYTASGDILVIAATMGICVNPKTNMQRYMSEHDEDIVSVAITHVIKKHGSYSRVATGDSGRHPKIVVWETNTMRVLTVLKDSHQHRGVTKLAFTQDG
jgi:WD40 repeat protein